MKRLALAASLAGMLALAALHPDGIGKAQGAARFGNLDDARAALDLARQQAVQARERAQKFEESARESGLAVEKSQAEAAALAARIQQAEAAITMAEAELALVESERRALDLRLAERREPIVRLTAALQGLVDRPLSLSLFAPGSLRETVYVGAVLDSTVPIVRQRTASLRAELDRLRSLQATAREAVASRQATEQQLDRRRAALLALAQRRRVQAQEAAGAAEREERRAIALAERARDIDGLMTELGELGELRSRLAALPGPLPRPRSPETAIARRPAAVQPSPAATSPPSDYRLPVDGRVVTGFGERDESGGASQGLQIVPRSSAQVVAPARGRVAFAGPYRGYGAIVIVEHPNGWTSLVTGLADTIARVGQQVVAGSPIGIAGQDPLVTVELRHEREAVNPLEFVS